MLCIHGADDLEPRKVYQVLPDRAAMREDCVRVIGDSGEDYLYPAEYFVPLKLPVTITREWISPSNRAPQPRAVTHAITRAQARRS